MATNSDDKVIDRESLKLSLADRYLSGKKAGGAFNAYAASTNNMLQGLGPGTIGSQKSMVLTVEPGFTINSTQGKENFKESVLTNDNSTIYKSGFNNKKYTDGQINR